MPILSTDVEFRQSGTVNLGDAISAVPVSPNLNGLFDYVTGAESTDGDTEYRCVYIRNSHATLTFYGVKLWIASNTPAAGTHCQIGLGTSAINGAEQAVANEGTAPFGVTFYDAINEAGALAIGDIPAGQHKAIWIKRAVTAGAAAYNNDGITLSVKGDSGA